MVIPQATIAELRKSAWLYPHFVGEDDTLKLSIHALLVEAPGLKLVVDTCIGNDRPREITGGRPLATPFLQHLGEAGWSRDGVDAVVCTHLHVDPRRLEHDARERQVGADLPEGALPHRSARVQLLERPR
jgi:hypothetical protein